MDVSVFKVVSTIQHLKDSKKSLFSDSTIPTFYEERFRDLTSKVIRDVSIASTKLDCKNDGNRNCHRKNLLRKTYLNAKLLMRVQPFIYG